MDMVFEYMFTIIPTTIVGKLNDDNYIIPSYIYTCVHMRILHWVCGHVIGTVHLWMCAVHY